MDTGLSEWFKRFFKGTFDYTQFLSYAQTSKSNPYVKWDSIVQNEKNLANFMRRLEHKMSVAAARSLLPAHHPSPVNFISTVLSLHHLLPGFLWRAPHLSFFFYSCCFQFIVFITANRIFSKHPPGHNTFLFTGLLLVLPGRPTSLTGPTGLGFCLPFQPHCMAVSPLASPVLPRLPFLPTTLTSLSPPSQNLGTCYTICLGCSYSLPLSRSLSLPGQLLLMPQMSVHLLCPQRSI